MTAGAVCGVCGAEVERAGDRDVLECEQHEPAITGDAQRADREPIRAAHAEVRPRGLDDRRARTQHRRRDAVGARRERPGRWRDDEPGGLQPADDAGIRRHDLRRRVDRGRSRIGARGGPRIGQRRRLSVTRSEDETQGDNAHVPRRPRCGSVAHQSCNSAACQRTQRWPAARARAVASLRSSPATYAGSSPCSLYARSSSGRPHAGLPSPR